MIKAVAHDFREEEIEAKVRWFKSLTQAELMEMLCSYEDVCLLELPGD
jgi:hypothetical protein